jgi:ATP-dependent Lon protease
VTDSSVLKGHRRTYVGAYSGKIISALKACESSNPVILLD